MKLLKKLLPAALFLCALSSQAWAAAITIDMQWSGAAFQNSARATGWMTIDSAAIPNPGGYANDFSLPSWLLDLSITVSGASSGNGVFTLADFMGMRWNTNGGTLDLTSQLIGQPTSNLPWGTADNNRAGDLNFFSSSSSSAPSGTWWFTLATNHGTGDEMLLTSASVPEPGTYSLIGMGLLGFLALVRKRGIRR